ncbi:dipeptide ABC transporter ATP-binding protein [Roseomonas haemaphysalidis]|uniref:ABC transporter ATP-binding protein n=1 Tax=Roseomonas haemaphysalidis TaxID=2768162 RepID=A0ABS3KJS8_9PROT|nr:ABC transporter ATP-binding protein [Roseomonas haemaphysalidis]MBO1077700.1 ABC transporter ATP-binding protein [Roseomonas haemaphysalidis]
MAEPESDVLDLRDLRVEIGAVRAVRGVSLRIARGEVLGLVGESGSGKSMTALSIAGLTPAAARISVGHLSVAGQVLARTTPAEWRRLRRDVVGFVFQNAMRALNPRLTVGALIREALPAGEQDAVTAHRRALALMEDVGIDRARDRLSQYPHELSGGLAQRVVIALALARRPKLLIADEPTTALDVSVQAQILDLIDRLRREHGLGVLLVSHDLEVIGDRADRVAVMYAGEIVEAGPCRDVIGRPSHDYTRSLLAATPGRLIADRAEQVAPAPRPRSRPLAEAVGVSRSFAAGGLRLPWRPARRRDAVRDVTVTVRPGESLGIVGESGSGKTTLARMLVGLETPDTGDIRFDGREVRGLDAAEKAGWRRDVQFIFQDNAAALDPRHTIGHSILEPLSLRSLSRAEQDARLRKVLEEVSLPAGFATRRPHQLSGGQRQRVGIARALISDPRLIIADEPVSALDVSVQAVIMKLLNRLRAQRGISYVVISHDIGVIRYLCDRIAVMRHGQVVEAGDTLQVLDDPQHAYTRNLLDAVPGTMLRRHLDRMPTA